MAYWFMFSVYIGLLLPCGIVLLRVGSISMFVFVYLREREREKDRLHYSQVFANYPPKLEVKKEKDRKYFFLPALIHIHCPPATFSCDSPLSFLHSLSSPPRLPAIHMLFSN